jgi:hypothetical protein
VGHVVARLVEALRYKPESRGYGSRCHWNFLLTYFFRPHLAPKRNEHQKYFLRDKGCRCVGLTNLPPSFADYLEICESKRRGNFRACTGLLYLERDWLLLLRKTITVSSVHELICVENHQDESLGGVRMGYHSGNLADGSM